MRGIKKLTMFSRKLSFLSGSKLDLRAPGLPRRIRSRGPGADGHDGKSGVHGPVGR